MSATPRVEDVDQARAREYSLLATLLQRSPDAELLGRLANLRGDGSPLGAAHAALGEAASGADAERIGREYFALFIGVGRGELLPYASYYQTGSLHGRPLAKLRQTLRQIGIVRDGSVTEPEDHAAILFQIMAGLAGGHIAAPDGTGREVFESYLAPWAGRFFQDLEQAKAADFYVRVGALGRLFMAIETEAFTMLGAGLPRSVLT